MRYHQLLESVIDWQGQLYHEDLREPVSEIRLLRLEVRDVLAADFSQVRGGWLHLTQQESAMVLLSLLDIAQVEVA
jgi:hypothetical protein